MYENVTEKAIWNDKLILKNCFFFFEKSYVTGNVSCRGGHDNPEVFLVPSASLTKSHGRKHHGRHFP